jgi:hypothetical protein
MAEKQRAFLTFLPQASKRQLKLLLKTITREQLNAIGEVSYNVLYGNIAVGELKHRKQLIRTLGDKRTPHYQRKELVCKHPKLVVELIQTVLP